MGKVVIRKLIIHPDDTNLHKLGVFGLIFWPIMQGTYNVLKDKDLHLFSLNTLDNTMGGNIVFIKKKTIKKR